MKEGGRGGGIGSRGIAKTRKGDRGIGSEKRGRMEKKRGGRKG